MATTKTRQELVRLAWVTALRQQGDRQCHGSFTSGDKVCALTVLREVSGDSQGRLTLGELAGISNNQFADIILLNDAAKATFSEIADVVESWFSKE